MGIPKYAPDSHSRCSPKHARPRSIPKRRPQVSTALQSQSASEPGLRVRILLGSGRELDAGSTPNLEQRILGEQRNLFDHRRTSARINLLLRLHSGDSFRRVWIPGHEMAGVQCSFIELFEFAKATFQVQESPLDA